MKKIIARVTLFSFLVNLLFPLILFAAEPSAKSSMKIFSNVDGAAIYLDTEETGLVTPVSKPVELEPGYHMIRVEKEGFTTFRKDFILTSGESMELEVILLPVEVTESQKRAFKNMDKKPINKRWWFWVLVLAAVGAAVANEEASSDGGSVLVSW